MRCLHHLPVSWRPRWHPLSCEAPWRPCTTWWSPQAGNDLDFAEDLQRITGYKPKHGYWLVVSNIVFPHNIWDNPSHRLIFFKMVKTTNQWLVVTQLWDGVNYLVVLGISMNVSGFFRQNPAMGDTNKRSDLQSKWGFATDRSNHG